LAWSSWVLVVLVFCVVHVVVVGMWRLRELQSGELRVRRYLKMVEMKMTMKDVKIAEI